MIDGGASDDGRPSSSKRPRARRAGAVLLVVCLLALVGLSPVLFDVADDRDRDERSGSRSRSRSKGIPSVYATIATSATRCLPESARSSLGGSKDVEAIADNVEELRGLDFETPPEVEFMTPDELAAYVTEVSQQELVETETELLIDALEKLAIVPEGFDIEGLVESTSGQVLGLYEPETRRLLVGGSSSLEPAEVLTVAHELGHAVTDQVLGFPSLRFRANRADAQLAERALIEGDATMLMQHYGMIAFPDDLQELLSGSATDEQVRDYQSLPYFLQRSFSFPYAEGYLFACELYAAGGWRAIDRAYENPPSSTLEILFPRRFGDVDIEEPDRIPSPGGDWKSVYAADLGAADLQWMFEAPGGQATGNMAEAAHQVSRWRGGRFELWQRGEELTVVLAVVEGSDLSGTGASTICHRLVRWYTESQPEATFLDGGGAVGAWRTGGDVAMVDCEDDQTRLVVAPSLRSATRVVEL